MTDDEEVIEMLCGTDDNKVLEKLCGANKMLTPDDLAIELDWWTVRLPDTKRVKRALDRLMKRELVDQSTVYEALVWPLEE
jgi:hypothetical protein